MSQNPKDPDSWKNFIGFQCFIMLFMTPFMYVLVEGMAPKGQVPGGGWGLLNILLGLISSCALGLIHRLISGRNKSLGFWYILGFVPTILLASDSSLTFFVLLKVRAVSFLALAVFVVVVDSVALWNERRKTRKRKRKLAHDPLMDDIF